MVCILSDFNSKDPNGVEKAMLVMDQCLHTPGALLKMLEHSDAMQVFAIFMKEKRYPEARVKILGIGHEECDLQLVEKAAANMIEEIKKN